jgi:integrase
MDTYSAMHHKPSTQKSYRDSLDVYLIPEFGDLPLDKITRKHVKEFLQDLHTKKLKSGTIRNHKAYLSAILSEAVDDEILDANPASRTGKHIVKGMKEEINPLTWEESVKYLETAKAHFPRHYPMALTLCRTGMRLGEVVALKPGDLDFNGRFIEVQRSYSKGQITTPKTNHKRRLDMSSQLAEVLKAYLVERKKETLANGWKEVPEFLFYDTWGGLLDEDHWRRRVHTKILEKAGLRHIRIHDLRHTYSTLRVAKGDNLVDVSKQLGHASVKMTLDVYTHWIPGGKKSEVDGLDSVTAPVANNVEAKNG